MRILAALGGNALLRRGEPADVAVQLHNLAAAIPALTALARDHELVITHGNGPQVGLLAAESAADPALIGPYPLDVLGAQTQGMIGYWLVRELAGALPGREIVAVLTQTVVAADDPALATATKFVGPSLDPHTAAIDLVRRGWQVRRDGAAWRRVVPSPAPLDIVELPAIRRLVDAGVLVVAAGGGGVPVTRTAEGRLHGVDAVVDKDHAAAVLGIALKCDLLLLLTDVPAVSTGFGTTDAAAIHHATPEELEATPFPAGSMGPKVAAACRFVRSGGRRAVIGELSAATALAAGFAGTQISTGGE
jgi:carbamate kinase